MYKVLFQNSKAALVFAGMTIIGAVTMVGSGEDSGVLTKAVDRLSKTRTVTAEAPPQPAETPPAKQTVSDPASGWGSAPSPAIGDYSAGNPTSAAAPSSTQPTTIAPQSAAPNSTITGVYVKPIQD